MGCIYKVYAHTHRHLWFQCVMELTKSTKLICQHIILSTSAGIHFHLGSTVLQKQQSWSNLLYTIQDEKFVGN